VHLDRDFAAAGQGCDNRFASEPHTAGSASPRQRATLFRQPAVAIALASSTDFTDDDRLE
jgi:hypothetical protein